jgi:crotonobetainyl-CoA:carnitine CoA-transferase CaiB-like acyl-CoA transferase
MHEGRPGGSESSAESYGDVDAGPFSGLTVVEFGQFVVGPFCAQFLADGGARVIKVEPPEGDSYRLTDTIGPLESRQYITKNRGKASIAIQLSNPRSDEVLKRLIEIADVVIVNMRQETVEKRRLRYEDVAEISPRVVYGAVTAFGSAGPEASYPGMDVVVQARSGMLLALGAERDGVPFHSEVQVADYTTAMLLLTGIASALYTRAATGRG